MPPAAPPTRILHRQMAHALPVAVAGEGIHLVDAQGRRYIDASGGAAVSCLGHGHPEVRAAMHAQLDRLAYAHTSFFTTEAAEQLAERLVRDAPAGTSHAYFVSGGSEAVEAALKLARQFFVETGRPQRLVGRLGLLPLRREGDAAVLGRSRARGHGGEGGQAAQGLATVGHEGLLCRAL